MSLVQYSAPVASSASLSLTNGVFAVAGANLIQNAIQSAYYSLGNIQCRNEVTQRYVNLTMSSSKNFALLGNLDFIKKTQEIAEHRADLRCAKELIAYHIAEQNVMISAIVSVTAFALRYCFLPHTVKRSQYNV